MTIQFEPVGSSTLGRGGASSMHQNRRADMQCCRRRAGDHPRLCPRPQFVPRPARPAGAVGERPLSGAAYAHANDMANRKRLDHNGFRQRVPFTARHGGRERRVRLRHRRLRHRHVVAHGRPSRQHVAAGRHQPERGRREVGGALGRVLLLGCNLAPMNRALRLVLPLAALLAASPRRWRSTSTPSRAQHGRPALSVSSTLLRPRL